MPLSTSTKHSLKPKSNLGKRGFSESESAMSEHSNPKKLAKSIEDATQCIAININVCLNEVNGKDQCKQLVGQLQKNEKGFILICKQGNAKTDEQSQMEVLINSTNHLNSPVLLHCGKDDDKKKCDYSIKKEKLKSFSEVIIIDTETSTDTSFTKEDTKICPERYTSGKKGADLALLRIVESYLLARYLNKTSQVQNSIDFKARMLEAIADLPPNFRMAINSNEMLETMLVEKMFKRLIDYIKEDYHTKKYKRSTLTKLRMLLYVITPQDLKKAMSDVENQTNKTFQSEKEKQAFLVALQFVSQDLIESLTMLEEKFMSPDNKFGSLMYEKESANKKKLKEEEKKQKRLKFDVKDPMLIEEKKKKSWQWLMQSLKAYDTINIIPFYAKSGEKLLSDAAKPGGNKFGIKTTSQSIKL